MVKSKNKIFSIALCLILCLAMVLGGIKIASGRNGVSADGDVIKAGDYKINFVSTHDIQLSESYSSDYMDCNMTIIGGESTLNLSKIGFTYSNDSTVAGITFVNSLNDRGEVNFSDGYFRYEIYRDGNSWHFIIDGDSAIDLIEYIGYDDFNLDEDKDGGWSENAKNLIIRFNNDCTVDSVQKEIFNALFTSIGGETVEETGIDLYSTLVISGAMLVVACGCAVVMSKMKKKENI